MSTDHQPADQSSTTTHIDQPTLTIDDVRQAHARISKYVHRTPVLTCQAISQRAGRDVYFKCENLQKVGAFKFRGAINAVAQLTDAQKANGVVTHSSGNHAQALALAARTFGIGAHIVMPTSASKVKRDAVIGYGANVIDCDPNLQARESTAERVQQETGATMIPPYDHPHIIAGQGTAALELLEEIPDLDAVMAPVGGGGLIAGTCVTCRDWETAPKVFAAEPAGADDAFRSKQAGKWIPQTDPNTIADGLLTSTGQLTWPYVRDVVHEVITVDDDQIIDAMKFFWQRAKLLIEPSSATVFAAIFSDAFKQHSSIQKIGVIISGGNVDLNHLPW
jgi:threonine dehydratase